MGVQADSTLQKLRERFGFDMPRSYLSVPVIAVGGRTINFYEFMDECLLMSVRKLDDGKRAFIFGSKGVGKLVARLTSLEVAKGVVRQLVDVKLVDEEAFSVVTDKYANKHKAKK